MKKTYYDPNYFINTNGRNDLVIHSKETPDSAIAVIIEAKKVRNKAEMITKNNLNKFSNKQKWFSAKKPTFSPFQKRNASAKKKIIGIWA